MILKNQKVTVVGLGRSGFAAARFLAKKKALVRITDHSRQNEVLKRAVILKDLGVSVETGGHTHAFISGADFVVTSPGVSKKSLPLVFAKRHGIPVISEVELASFFCQGLTVAITGSNGKTTTSHLIFKMIADAGRKSVLCGNVGDSFLGFIPKIDKKTVVVLELSSFQLEDSPTLKPKIAVVLNISPNHLDRHQSLRNYVRVKQKIFENQEKNDFVILNHDDPLVRKMATLAGSRVIFFSKRPISEGVFLEGDKIIAKIRGKKKTVLQTRNFQLRGTHNIENVMAGVAVASLLGIAGEKIQSTLDAFKTLKHRIEPIGSLNGVCFMNDSKSTTIESTRCAISSVATPLILVAGGRDKGAHFAEIEKLLENRVKRVVLYGEARKKIAESWKNFHRYKMKKSFKEAVKCAFRSASPEDTLLLSPMCASFDQFHSFEERGEAFKQIFKELQWNR